MNLFATQGVVRNSSRRQEHREYPCSMARDSLRLSVEDFRFTKWDLFRLQELRREPKSSFNPKSKIQNLKLLLKRSSTTYQNGGRTKVRAVSASIGIAIASIPVAYKSAVALPPKEDTPEEVLRTEIILEARSPVDGKPLTAAEYAELQAQLQTRSTPPKLNPKVRDQIFLLRFRKALRTFLPFLPI